MAVTKNIQRPADEYALELDEIESLLPPGVEMRPDQAYRLPRREAWLLDLYLPRSGAEKRPGLMFVHGGGWFSGGKRRALFARLAARYAGRGFVTCSANYRLAGEAPFPACVNDLRAALAWLARQAKRLNLDPGRIGLFGNSAGAHLVSLLALAPPALWAEERAPTPPAARAVFAGAVAGDLRPWAELLEQRPMMRGFMPSPQEAPLARLAEASPITYITPQAPPFMIVQGGQDKMVPPELTDGFVRALKAAGTPVSLLRFEEAGHEATHARLDEILPRLDEFFGRL